MGPTCGHIHAGSHAYQRNIQHHIRGSGTGKSWRPLQAAPKSPSGSSNASGSLAGAGALVGLAGAAGAVC